MLLEDRRLRDELFDTVLLERRFDERDQLRAGHCVQFDAPGAKKPDFLAGRAVPLQCEPPFGPLAVARALHRLRFKSHLLRVGEAKPDIDQLDVIGEPVSAAVTAERAADAEPGDVEVVQNEDVLDVIRQPVDEHPGGGDAHALGRHQGDVEPLLNPR